MNKPVYLGLSVLDLSKTGMYEFSYHYVKLKYGKNAKLCYIDTGSFTVHLKTGEVYKDIAKVVEKRFDTSNFEIDRPLPIRTNEKVIGLMKNELGGQIMKKFVGLIAKTHSYLKDNDDENKKAKGAKKCVIKRNLKFSDYKKSLKASQIDNKINYLEKMQIDVDCFKDDKKELVKTN